MWCAFVVYVKMADGKETGVVARKFEGANYIQWKFQIKCALRAKGLWSIADGTKAKPANAGDEQERWVKQDAQAMFILTASMEFEQITLIENCDSSKEILDKLDSIYLQKSETNKMIVHERFHQYKMEANDSIAQHIAKVESLAKHVKEAGDQISEAAIMMKIISTLPPKYRNFRQAWLSLDDAKQNIPNLTSRLLDEEKNLTSYEETEVAMATLSISRTAGDKNRGKNQRRGHAGFARSSRSTTSSSVICYRCKKRGHVMRNCTEKRDRQTADGNRYGEHSQEGEHRVAFNYKSNDGVVRQHRSADTAFIVQESAFNVEKAVAMSADVNDICWDDHWLMDSGASAHMCYRKEFFESLDDEINSTVVLGNGERLTVKGRGTVRIQKLLQGEWLNATITNVLFVPELRRNLFSEGVVTGKNMKIVKQNTHAEILDSSGIIAVAEKDGNNTYKMLFRTLVNSANLVLQDSLKVWHQRLGHLNIASICTMVEKGYITGINLSDKDKFFCEACALGKSHKLPFEKKDHVKLNPGERVYSDLCGPMNVPSVSGARYFMLVKDECSGYRVVYFIRHKSDALECFKIYNNKMKNKFGKSVGILHVDNGTEYTNKDFKDYLSKEGITLELTAPYTPEQNSRVERDNRTIIESARAMMSQNDMPKYLWAETVNTAVYILNRTPTKQTPESTPYEVWTRNKPFLGHLKICGCTAFAHIPDIKRTKLDSKSKKLIFVGYDGNSTNYRLFDPMTRKITVSRNVIFDEKIDNTSCNSGNAATSLIDGRRMAVGAKAGTMTRMTANLDGDCFNFGENVYNEFETENDQEFDGNVLNNEEPDLPVLRPSRNVRIPAKYHEYQLYFAETEVPQTYTEALASPEASRWKAAMDEELQALDKNSTWDLVPHPKNSKVLQTKWVYKIKRDTDGEVSRYKARLCVKGCAQKAGSDYNEIFAPTTRYDSIRVLLAIAAQNCYELMQFDVKTAFLYGELDEKVFMYVPEGLKPPESTSDLVCKLNKSLYGLKQAPRCWNRRFHQFLNEYGFQRCETDRCLYMALINNIKVILVIFVDDGLILSESRDVILQVLQQLKLEFEVTTCELSYYVGMQIQRNPETGSIFIYQKRYIEQLIAKFGLENANSCSTPEDHSTDLTAQTGNLLEEGEVPYRQAIGSLLFLATVTRPDISHAVGVLSRAVNNPTKAHWNGIKRVIRYLIGTTNYGILYSKQNGSKSALVGFSDSDYAGDRATRRSTTGYLFKLAGGPITWSSRKQSTVSLSTTEAEYVAASSAVKESLWLHQLLKDIQEDDKLVLPMTLYIDNQSAIKLVKNSEFHQRSKHIDIKFHFIREQFEKGVILPQYVNTASQEADIFTKALSKIVFEKLRDKICVEINKIA